MGPSAHRGFTITEADEPLIAKLPDAFQEILLLSKTVAGKDLAAALQVAPGTAKSRLNRARSALAALRPLVTP